MILPSLQNNWKNGKTIKPRIRVLEIREKTKTNEPALGWLLLGREEIRSKDSRDGSIWEASIRLSYRRIGPKHSYIEGKGSFEGGYRSGFGYGETVSLTSTGGSSGAVFLDLPGLEGQRIGTYLFNEIIEWAREWPQASVNRISLNSLQADAENKERRNRFYERFNIKFNYSDASKESGGSCPMKVDDLMLVNSCNENIRDYSLQEYIEQILFDKNDLQSELIRSERAFKYLKEEIRQAEQHPIRWAIKVLWNKARGILIPIFFFIFIAVIIYGKLKT